MTQTEPKASRQQVRACVHLYRVGDGWRAHVSFARVGADFANSHPTRDEAFADARKTIERQHGDSFDFEWPSLAELDEAASLRARVAELEEKAKNAFQHGYLIACCNIVSLHDETIVAADVLIQEDFSPSFIEALGLSEYDKAALEKIRREPRARAALEGRAEA